MEISDAQFEYLTGLIAESRVEMRQGLSDLRIEIRDGFAGVRKGQIIANETAQALEADVGGMQRVQRAHGEVLGRIEQAVDGLTQLGKTNFDMNESILKKLHGEESGTVSHGQESRESESGPQ